MLRHTILPSELLTSEHACLGSAAGGHILGAPPKHAAAELGHSRLQFKRLISSPEEFTLYVQHLPVGSSESPLNRQALWCSLPC